MVFFRLCASIDYRCQEIESKTAGVTTTHVWGLRYIDDLICRDKVSERLFALQDANWNVVAITDTNGVVKERIAYNAFGKPTWLSASYGGKTTSGYSWNRTFTGQVYDPETGLMLYRNRFYHSGLGRFVRRDPIGYAGNDTNIYRYVKNKTTAKHDIYGLKYTNSGVKWCLGYQKGAVILGGVMPTHWFLKIGDLGFGMFEENLNVAGDGQIRFDDNALYPELPPSMAKEDQFYSICYDIQIEDSCYDKTCFEYHVRQYANYDPGIYISGVKDCRSWTIKAVKYAKGKCRSRCPSWRDFFKCIDHYMDEGTLEYTSLDTLYYVM